MRTNFEKNQNNINKNLDQTTIKLIVPVQTKSATAHACPTMKLKHLVSLAVIFGAGLQATQAQSLDHIFRKFSQCDASFFEAMKNDSQSLQAVAPTDSKGDALWIKVPNRNAAETATTPLVGKPTIGGLPVASYLDEASDLGSLGRFYY